MTTLSDLPDGILDCILSKIPSTRTIVQFALVCKHAKRTVDQFTFENNTLFILQRYWDNMAIWLSKRPHLRFNHIIILDGIILERYADMRMFCSLMADSNLQLFTGTVSIHLANAVSITDIIKMFPLVSIIKLYNSKVLKDKPSCNKKITILTQKTIIPYVLHNNIKCIEG
jgi:hypothetical protein